ncbi:hypothetical protein DM02DRAFT_327860 [Periconia macrospinosa]|uniref:Uncharacterized protein n=1 Tax=Periconia macrospinosa TaxID=97972 RepID=A0A2V1EAE5_9PLEO|nr:hypothetical protein DM02DRAFT_327860 [Periconia macrospinosa]
MDGTMDFFKDSIPPHFFFLSQSATPDRLLTLVAYSFIDTWWIDTLSFFIVGDYTIISSSPLVVVFLLFITVTLSGWRNKLGKLNTYFFLLKHVRLWLLALVKTMNVHLYCCSTYIGMQVT